MATLAERLKSQFRAEDKQIQSNIDFNEKFIRGENTIDAQLANLGQRQLSKDQLLDIDPDLFTQDPVAAVDEVFHEDDPRVGQLSRIRDRITRFVSDPRNRGANPADLLISSFEKEEQLATPRLLELADSGNSEIIFPRSVLESLGRAREVAKREGRDAIARDDAGVPSGLVRGATSKAAEDFGTNLAISGVIGGVSAGIRGAALTRNAQGRLVRRGFLKTRTGKFLRAGGRKSVLATISAAGVRAGRRGVVVPIIGKQIARTAAGKLLIGLGRAAGFVPHPVGRAAAVVLTSLATLTGLSAVQGARRTVTGKQFDRDHPIGALALDIGIQAGAVAGVRKLALISLLRKEAAGRALRGDARAVGEISVLNKEFTKGRRTFVESMLKGEERGAKLRRSIERGALKEITRLPKEGKVSKVTPVSFEGETLRRAKVRAAEKVAKKAARTKEFRTDVETKVEKKGIKEVFGPRGFGRIKEERIKRRKAEELRKVRIDSLKPLKEQRAAREAINDSVDREVSRLTKALPAARRSDVDRRNIIKTIGESITRFSVAELQRMVDVRKVSDQIVAAFNKVDKRKAFSEAQARIALRTIIDRLPTSFKTGVIKAPDDVAVRALINKPFGTKVGIEFTEKGNIRKGGENFVSEATIQRQINREIDSAIKGTGPVPLPENLFKFPINRDITKPQSFPKSILSEKTVQGLREGAKTGKTPKQQEARAAKPAKKKDTVIGNAEKEYQDRLTSPSISKAVRDEDKALFTKLLKGGADRETAARAVNEARVEITAQRLELANQFERAAELRSGQAKKALEEARLIQAGKKGKTPSASQVDEMNRAITDLNNKFGRSPTRTEIIIEFKKRGLLSLIATGVGASVVLGSNDSEAGVVQEVAKLVKNLGQRVEAKTFKDLSANILRKEGETDLQFIGRMRTLSAERPDLRIFNSVLRIQKLTGEAEATGLNLDKTTMRGVVGGPADAIFGSIFNRFRSMGDDGEKLTQMFMHVDDTSEIATKEWVSKLINAMPLSFRTGPLGKKIGTRTFRSNLTKEEGEAVHKILNDNDFKGASEGAVELATSFRKLLDDMYEKAKAAGVTLPSGKRKDYFPHILKPGALQNDRDRFLMIESLMKNDKLSKDEANEVLKNMMRDKSEAIFTGILNKSPTRKSRFTEKSRQFQMPKELYLGGDGKNVIEALSNYGHQVELRISQAKTLGKNSEKVTGLKNNLIADGQDPRFINDAIDVLMGNKPIHMQLKEGFLSRRTKLKMIGISRAFEAIDLLGYAGLSQLGQLNMLNAIVGPVGVLKAAFKQLTDKNVKKMTEAAAVTSETLSKHLLENFATVSGLAGRASKAALNTYLILPIDHNLRKIAGAAGAEYATKLAESLTKFKGKEIAKGSLPWRQFRELGMDANKVLKNVKAGKNPFTDEEMLIVMKRMSDLTQFRSRPGDLPLWFASEPAQMITLFKRFLFQSGSFIHQQIWKEFTKGNFRPALRAGLAAPFLGDAIQDSREFVKSQIFGATGESRKSLRKVTKRREKLVSGKSAITSPIDMLGGSSVAKILDDATYVLAIGMLPDLIESIIGGDLAQATRTIAGPNIDRLRRVSSAFYKDLDKAVTGKRSEERIKKEFYRILPFGLRENIR